MDRCALFVDAGYVLADGAMAVHGTRRRESVSWDYAGLVQLFGNLALERTSLPLLRCYWYEATAEGLRSAEHDTLADLPGVKLRVAKARPGRREGVEGEMHRDLTTLARNKAVSDVMVVSAEEDLAQVIAYVQDMGMRVTLLHIAVDGEGTAPRALRQETDDFMEISATQLAPYVELISGAEPPRPDEAESAAEPQLAVAGTGFGTGPSNGNGYHGYQGSGQPPAAARATGYPQADYQQAEYQQAAEPAQPADQAVSLVPQPAAADVIPADPGQPGQPEPAQPERAESAAATDYPPVADFAASVDYSASVDYGAPAPEQPAAEQAAPEQPAAVAQPAAVDYTSPFDYGSAPDYGPVREYTAPVTAAVPLPPREDPYTAPAAVPAAADERRGDRDRLSATGRLNADLSAYTPGAVREPYQRDGGSREAGGLDTASRLQPVPVSYSGSGSAQVRRLSARPGMLPAGPNQGQPAPGPVPPAPALVTVAPSTAPPGSPEAAAAGPQPGNPQLSSLPAGGSQLSGFQPGGSQAGGPPLNGPVPGGLAPGGHPSVGQPTGSQPVVPVAPVVPMDPGAMGYAARGGASGAPRPVSGGPGGPVGLAGAGDNQGFGAPPALGPGAPGSQPPLAAPPAPLLPPGPGAPSGPIGLVGPGGYAGGTPGVSLADAVQSAHEEGQAFGESVARDAPALWLEAVLARKPRMPSDLEARLLQGSALPIDFLLHDEVRHALRRGFWDALERARR